MASELFLRLYHEAFQREEADLIVLGALWDNFGERSLVKCLKMLIGLGDADKAFQERLAEVAATHRIRMRPTRTSATVVVIPVFKNP